MKGATMLTDTGNVPKENFVTGIFQTFTLIVYFNSCSILLMVKDMIYIYFIMVVVVFHNEREDNAVENWHFYCY